MTRYVVIGSGAAGIAALMAIRSVDKNGELILVMAEKEGYYSRPGLAYYLNKELSDKHLFPFTKIDFEALKVQMIHGEVKNIEHNSHIIRLLNGKIIQFDKLLIAVGASAVPATIPGNELKGVVYLDRLSKTKELIKSARKAKIAVVVGGGITAIELVEGLVSQNVKVHFFLRKERFWGNVLDKEESCLIERRLKDEGVIIHYQTEADEIIAKKGKVFAIKTKGGKEIRCQMVAFAIGVRPRVQIANNSGIDFDRGILVNQYLETNLPNIYAAGDVAQVFDPLAGKSVVDSLWDPARKQGHTAGLNMAGQKKPYVKDVPFNVTRLAGLTTSIIGVVGNGNNKYQTEIVRGESETWHQIPDAIACQNNLENNRIRLMIGKKYILGAIIMGDQTLSEAVHQLIKQKVDISLVRDTLLIDQAPISDTLALFWQQWRKEHAN